ncbi:MAG: CPBP family intramembrane glutamic endopeptidase [Thermoleophilaceae bacterium]
MTTEPGESRPRWPAWYGPAGFLAGLVCTLIAASVVSVVVAAAGGHLRSKSPGFQFGGTLVQDLFFIGAAVVLAARVAPPRAADFGLRGAPLRLAAREAGKALLAFYLFALLYHAVFQPHGQQDVAKDLGVSNGGIDVALAAVLVVVFAPIAEEFFFRGFFYGALRSRFAVLPAAAIDGLVFGAIHYTGPKTLSLLPVLMVFGFILCLLYERTGSLLVTIPLHVLNNTIAWVGSLDQGHGLVLALGGVTIAVCAVLLHTLAPRGEPVAA